LRFFFDNNLPPRLAKAIQALVATEHEVMHLTDKFAANTTDVTWLKVLGAERDWVLICGDPRITKRPHELKALQEARLLSFFLKGGWTNLTLWVIAHKLVQWWPNIMETARCIAPPASFLVPMHYGGKGGRLDPLRLA
jgi:hypothetical protein